MTTVKPNADSDQYLQKTAFFKQLITVYGRKPVLEVLQDRTINIFRLHLADSNRRGGIIDCRSSDAEENRDPPSQPQ